MNVIPLDATLVRGSHGRVTAPAEGPLFLSSERGTMRDEILPATGVRDAILQHLFDAAT
jgi:hypothetical protein